MRPCGGFSMYLLHPFHMECTRPHRESNSFPVFGLKLKLNIYTLVDPMSLSSFIYVQYLLFAIVSNVAHKMNVITDIFQREQF